jgi:hypothetical protein
MAPPVRFFRQQIQGHGARRQSLKGKQAPSWRFVGGWLSVAHRTHGPGKTGSWDNLRIANRIAGMDNWLFRPSLFAYRLA